jgi:hypothetical protein
MSAWQENFPALEILLTRGRNLRRTARKIMPETDYSRLRANFRELDNKAAIAEWFESTEPRAETRPNTNRITSIKRADLILKAMTSKLQIDLLRCARYSWKWKTPLPGRNSYPQPLETDDG